MAEKRTETTTPSQETRVTRRETTMPGPFRVFDRLADDMDRLFEGFGFGRGWPAPRFGTDWLRAGEQAWLPDIELFQRNNEIVLRADLPGLTKDDVKVDVAENTVTIQGERRKEHEEEREGIYRSERSYGSFYRTVPLPEGAMADQAKATFRNGVLEVTMPAPPSAVKSGRRLEISEPAAQAEKK